MAYCKPIKQTLTTRIILAGLLFMVSLSCTNNKKPAEEAVTNNGQELYMKYCMACHQSSGSGVAGMYPSLQKTDWVEGDKQKLVGLLLNGQKGEIKVNGQVFRGVMPPLQHLTDDQVAAVLTYVRSNFGNNAPAVLPAEVGTLRKQLPDQQ